MPALVGLEPRGQLSLPLFAEQRLPRRPYCSEDLTTGVRIRPLRTALRFPYIQANPPHLRFWSIFDVDRPGAALSWEDSNLPPPAWAAVNRKNGHAHLSWGLEAPVLTADNARREPLRYLAAVESAFRARLRADPGYSGLITKNPLHEHWRVLYGPPRLYSLQELGEYVDLRKHLPKRKPEEIGLGRNCVLFDDTRAWAYRALRRYHDGGLSAWRAAVLDRAQERNGDFQAPLGLREVQHTARSVADWTWKRFDLAASDSKFSALQAARGRRSGDVRGERLAIMVTQAQALRAEGLTAADIASRAGVSERTAWRWLAAGRAKAP